jgi:hypothetical protein
MCVCMCVCVSNKTYVGRYALSCRYVAFKYIKVPEPQIPTISLKSVFVQIDIFVT